MKFSKLKKVCIGHLEMYISPEHLDNFLRLLLKIIFVKIFQKSFFFWKKIYTLFGKLNLKKVSIDLI